MTLIRKFRQGVVPFVLVGATLLASGSAQVQTLTVPDWTAERVAHLESEIGMPLPSTIEDLLDFARIPDTVDKQNYCLAQAIYFEARGEPVEGQFAVGRVVLNRVHDARYPATICGVVFQNRDWVDACQFSFACDGSVDQPKDPASWAMARRIANLVHSDVMPDTSGDATHYHADYVRPRWSQRLTQTAQYGRHIFYRDEVAE